MAPSEKKFSRSLFQKRTFFLACFLLAGRTAQAAGLCHGTDDTTRPIPPALAGPAAKLFGLSMPADMVVHSIVYRCVGRQILLCTAGANLPCGKADTARANPGAIAWCHDNPNSDMVPMVATGHDTIHQYRCVNGTARIAGAPAKVDARGFFAAYWKPLP